MPESSGRNDTGARDHAVADSYQEFVERYRVLWENTGNPLYVWRAIELSFRIAGIRARAETGSFPSIPPSDASYLPEWCAAYISLTACRIGTLIGGQDFRSFPKPFGEIEPSPDAWKKSVELAPSLKPDEAVKLIATALGFASPGKNAFRDLASLKSKEFDDLSIASLLDEGKSQREAIEIVMDETGVDDPRTIEKRLADVRRAYGLRKAAKPPP